MKELQHVCRGTLFTWVTENLHIMVFFILSKSLVWSLGNKVYRSFDFFIWMLFLTNTRIQIFFRSLANTRLSKHVHTKGATQLLSKFMKQCQEIKQNWIRRENVYMFLRNFWPEVPKFYFWKGNWVPPPIFEIFTVFSNWLSLKLFDNWWENVCTMFFVCDTMYHFICAETNLNWKSGLVG